MLYSNSHLYYYGLMAIIEKCYQILPRWLTSRAILVLNYLILKVSALFDKSYYFATNPDVANYRMDPVIHYLRSGAAEGRNPNPWFDTTYYMSNHPGTISAGINPLLHFILYGARHGARPNPLFDTPYYLAENPDIAKLGMNPLYHFIRSGKQQGRLPDPLFKDAASESDYKELVDASLQQEIAGSPKVSSTDLRNRLLTRRMLKLYDITSEQVLWMSKTSESFSNKPAITIVVFGLGPGDEFLESLKSIVVHAYPHWSVVILIDNESDLLRIECDSQVQALRDKGKLSFVSGKETIGSTQWVHDDFVAFLRAGDRLTPNALFEFALKINIKPDYDSIYCDEYRADSEEFFFKPGWSPELLFGRNYIGNFFMIRSSIFHELGGLQKVTSEDGIYDLLLRMSKVTSRVDHIAMPLLHITKSIYQNNASRLKRKINDQARVSIIIPTAYSYPHENLIPCLRTIVEKTSYSNYEIIIMDNSRGKIDVDTINQMVPGSKALRIVEYDKSFNYSLVMNRGASQAAGDYLLMLNDDIEIVTPDWIESMLECVQMDEIGVVGAKLLYPDGRIQHAGCFITDNRGYTRHAFQYMPDNNETYSGLSLVVRNCSFVTFACAMIRKELFFQLGQLDERLDVEYNDTDFCLRAIKSGYRVVYTPFATLIHKDSRTRSSVKMVKISRNIELFHDRWRDLIESGDPYYNPNLSLDTPDYAISDRPVLVDHFEPPSMSGDLAMNYDSREILHKPRGKESNPRLIIGIDPAPSQSMRSWPLEHFARLSNLLSEKLGAEIIFFSASPNAAETIAKVYDRVRKRDSAQAVDGVKNPGGLPDALGEVDLFISVLNDSSYLAAAIGVPTLVIWPGQVSPHEACPTGRRVMTVRMAPPCSPCRKTNPKQCPYDMKCLKMLWPCEVFEAARKTIGMFYANTLRSKLIDKEP